MLGCSTSQENQETFITNFEVHEDYIVVNYADGKNEKVKKTSENSEKIIAKMEAQFSNLEQYCINKKRSIRQSRILTAIYLITYIIYVCSAMFIYPIVSNYIVKNLVSILIIGGGVCNILAFLVEGKRTKKEVEEYTTAKNELEKFQIYLDNKKTLQECMKITEVINKTNVSKQDFQNRSVNGTININLIDVMSLEDLKELVSYLNKKQSLSLDRIECDEQTTEHPKTIAMMPNRINNK